MKRYQALIVLFTIVYSTHALLALEINAWCNRIVANTTNPEDYTLILTLLALSFQRSQSTLALQDEARLFLEVYQETFHDLMNHRLNPSRPYESVYSIKERARITQAFLKTMQRYQETNDAYAECVNTTLEDHLLTSRLESVVRALRKDARSAGIKELGRQALNVSNTYTKLKDLIQEHTRSETERGIISFIAQWAPFLNWNTLVSFEQQYNAFNNQLWQTVISSYALGNLLWGPFEQGRLTFYKECYTQLYKKICSEQNCALLYAFDAHGYIEPAERTTPLPDVNML